MLLLSVCVAVISMDFRCDLQAHAAVPASGLILLLQVTKRTTNFCSTYRCKVQIPAPYVSVTRAIRIARIYVVLHRTIVVAHQQ